MSEYAQSGKCYLRQKLYRLAQKLRGPDENLMKV